jgi:RNA-directed DNA polymerase
MQSQLLSDLQVSNTFINSLISNPSRYYIKQERIKKKFGRDQLDKHNLPKKRITLAPIAYLKSKQREINKYLQKVDLPKCIHGAVKEKNNITNSLLHLHGNYFFKVDLKDFFSKISNQQVNHALISYGFSWEEARIITKICTSNHCLPQGAPTSSTLANIVFAPTAIQLEKFCIEQEIIFTAFVDDLTFSAKHDFGFMKDSILDIIKQNGFFPNNKKIHYRRKSCEITGLIVKNEQLWIEKGMLQNLNNPKIKAYVNNVYKHFIRYKDQQKTTN